jgi:site-specific DNA-methyltransferase (adenine-specific)
VIPFEPLWKEYKRLIKDNGAIVLTASQPFTSALVMSNPKMFKVHIVWNKKKAGNFVQGNIQPMKVHEDIVIFYKKQPTYNPQKTQLDKPQKVRNGAKNRQDRKEAGGFGGTVIYSDKFEADKKLPTTIVEVSKDNYGKNVFHPTQKPVALFEYLIRTYTNEGDTVLDNCAGSFTTAIACMNTNRKYICIEKDKKYFEIGKNRIANHQPLLQAVNQSPLENVPLYVSGKVNTEANIKELKRRCSDCLLRMNDIYL